MLFVTLLSLILVIAITVWLFMRQPQFGKLPEGERKLKISRSPNFKDGQFRNLNVTPAITEGASYFSVMKKFLLTRNKNGIPPVVLPSVKTDLKALDVNKQVLVWFGHSSYFMQLHGKTVLVDPVFSGNASPSRFTTSSFKGSDIYTADDFPEIDYLLLTHDHYDHLDYRTIREIKSKVKQVITGLGVGAHLEHWGYDKQSIEEKDWNETIAFDDGFTVQTVPARHFSGRAFKRNGSLWLSFVLSTPRFKIFIGGDSGYDEHFKIIGIDHGPFDLAILENGQYNQDWKYIHMMPEEVVQAAIDLRANWLFPVHWSKFRLALHDWDEPMIRVFNEAERKNVQVISPMIGDAIDLENLKRSEQWWKQVKLR
jgi:L-ascorbate metabolism protein UlaG (beta-lactamase superfamily)